METMKTSTDEVAVRSFTRATHLSHQQLQQRGLACSVGSHQGHPRIQIDTELQTFIYERLRKTSGGT